ncbi:MULTISPECIES: phage tail protein [Pelosinus]|uniref:Phage tail fibre protein N-terminal domain-containing protein n=1 Tax=Pelosinus fermentans B4 TaxID=1149862 RepID=I9B456_9FIRM|nr:MULTISPECIES: phage tail protein [Pelosinus]EIW19902.1 Protein of unknown function DUF3751, tail fiber protein [Pelosinus fermentans B4]EIW21241.1 hypothetical protein FA11_0968 [Pelosinus fermentans A11]
MAYSVTTVKGREKFAQAHGTSGVLPKIVKMAFGDGGVDGSLEPVAPVTELTELGNELLRKDLEAVSYPVTTTVRYTGRLLTTELNGMNINEIALVDADGDVIAIKRFTNKGKDVDSELVFDWNEEF